MRVLSGRYELLEPLGRGGMGVVYRARDRELERIVAVKTLSAGLLRGAEQRERFRREARTAGGLSHPGIAAVYDIGEDVRGEETTPYLVMELVEGITLAELAKRERPTPQEAGRIVLAVLEALEHSHERGVVHRDIKPANVMVHRSGGRTRVKVMDFGIARLLSETATRLTIAGELIGTPSYMSPEQADGRPADERSDLYATGCVLYELLTGRPPFTGDSAAAVLFQHLQKAPEPPTRSNPALSPFWDEVTATALAKDPGDRYPDAAAMRRAVTSGTEEPETANSADAASEAAAPPAGFDAPTLGSVRSAPTEGRLSFGRPTVPSGAAPAAPHPLPSRPLPSSALPRRRLLTGVLAAGLAAALPGAYFVLAPDQGRPSPPVSTAPVPVADRSVSLTGHTGPVWSVAFSPDGEALASASQDGSVRLWDAETRDQRPLTGHDFKPLAVAFGPDGRTLATGDDGGSVRLWDTAAREQLDPPLTGHTGTVYAVAFSPDGEILAGAGEDGTVRLWDLATRRRLGRPLTGHVGAVTSLAFGPDGRTLASAGADESVRLWSVADRRQLGRPLSGHTGGVTSAAFSPDGRTLASASQDKSVRLWDVETLDQHSLTGHADIVYAVAFSRDGKTLATSSGDRTVRLWDVAAREQIDRPFIGLDDHVGVVYAVAFSPDGRTLATGGADAAVRLWRL